MGTCIHRPNQICTAGHISAVHREPKYVRCEICRSISFENRGVPASDPFTASVDLSDIRPAADSRGNARVGRAQPEAVASGFVHVQFC